MLDKSEIKILKNDGIGVIPTDTLLGLVGSAYSKKAIKKIFEAKGRNEKKPLIVLISKYSQLEKFFVSKKDIKKYEKFFKKYWPGKISIILKVPKNKFSYIHRREGSIAFRVPDSLVLRKLLQTTGPLVAPSANPEGETPARDIKQARKYFSDKVDFYSKEKLNFKEGLPSTIISFVGKNPKILREGAVVVDLNKIIF
jgi:L-threonylcarbamoyladenylate synthase